MLDQTAPKFNTEDLEMQRLVKTNWWGHCITVPTTEKVGGDPSRCPPPSPLGSAPIFTTSLSFLHRCVFFTTGLSFYTLCLSFVQVGPFTLLPARPPL